MAEKFIVVWTIDGETMSMPHSTQDEALQQAKLSCASMGAIWRSPCIWNGYLRRLRFGSIKSGCSSGVSMDFQSFKSKCVR